MPRLLRSVVAILLFVPLANAQIANKDRVYAVTGARIIVRPGRVLENATLVMRRGIIDAVGTDLPAPPDAESIDGRGLTLAPGFIDCFSALGRQAPASEAPAPAQAAPPSGGRRGGRGDGAPVPPGEAAEGSEWRLAEANRRGLTPELDVAEQAILSAENIKRDRDSGFLAACLTPRDNLYAGTGAVALLSGKSARDSILGRGNLHVLALDQRAVGTGSAVAPNYPSTTMGNLAHLRQFLLDVRRYRDQVRRYEASGRRTERPPFDAALAAGVPLIERSVRAALVADSEAEIHRALDFAREFGLDPAIVGGAEAAKVADRLREAHVPVILGLAFGDEPLGEGAGATGARDRDGEPRGRVGRGRWRRVSDDADRAAPTSSPAESRPAIVATAAESGPTSSPTSRPSENDEPRRVSEEKRKKWQARTANAAALEKAGVTFVFGTRGAKAPDDFMKALRKALDAGLSRDAALAALTTDAAAFFGVDRELGSLEPGKIANVLALTGDFGAPETTVRFVFADGTRFDVAADAAVAEAPAEGVQLTGSWRIDAENSRLLGEATLVLRQSGATVSGALESSMGTIDIKNGKLAGKILTFSLDLNFGPRPRTIEVKAEVKSKDSLAGTLDAMGGPQSFTATRTP